jgi:putative oxidoreductase
MPSKLYINSIQFFQRIPDSVIALIGRVSIAAIFWLSAQTKIDGFAINILTGEITLGWPRLSASAIDLFRDEYRLPLLSPEIAAPMAAFSEHVFAALMLIGLASRFSALALLGLTMVIQVFVYPDAYPTHGVWATVLLFIMARGPGTYSVDHLIAKRFAACNR